MKNSIFKTILFAVLSVAAVFTSCKKEPEVTPSIKFENVNALRQTVFADQTQAPLDIQFTTLGKWSSAVYAAPGSRTRKTPDWVVITPTEGKTAGDYTAKLLFGVNATGADRSAIIMLSLDTTMVSITVTQKGTTEKGAVPKTPTLPPGSGGSTNPTEPDPTDPTNPTNPKVYNMTGKINGTAFAWNGESGIIDGFLILEASNAAGLPSIMLSMPANVAAGKSYTMTADGDYSAYMITEDDFLDIETGTLTVTEHNTTTKTIKGTFTFKAGKYTVTEGTFNYKYSGETSPDYIKAKVNGADYSETAVTGSLSFGGITAVSVSSLTFSGTKKTMYISFPEGTGVGTYTIDGSPLCNYKAKYDDVSATSGSITITSFDAVKQIVKGTFNFVAGTYNVTNGEFSAELP